MADLLNKEQIEAEKDIAAWKELQAAILQAIMETIKGLFPGAEVEKGQGLTIEKKKRDPNQNLEIEQPLPLAPPSEASPAPGYAQLYGKGVNNLTPENIKAIHAILRSSTGDTIVGGEGLTIKFNGRKLYETDETGKIITHTGISHELRDRLEAIQPGAKSRPTQPMPSSAPGQPVGETAEAPAKGTAAENEHLSKGRQENSPNQSGEASVTLPNKDSKNTIEEAITYLASQDDGAQKKDGKGFNARDSYFGRTMAKDITDGATIDADRAKIALDLLQKYSRQLSTGGYSLPKWDDVKSQYPPRTIATDLSKEAAQERLAALEKSATSELIAPVMEATNPIVDQETELPSSPEPDWPIDAIGDEVDDSLREPSFTNTEPPVTRIPPKVEARSVATVTEPEPLVLETLDRIAKPETPVLEPVDTVAEPETLVLETLDRIAKPEVVVEAINVAPIAPEVTPAATEPTLVPEEPAPKVSLGQKISDAAKDAAKTAADVVVSKVKSDIEVTKDAVVRPITDAVRSKAQESLSFTAGVFKETVEDAVNLAGNTAENFKNAIGIKSVVDLSLVNKYYDAIRSISTGITPESNKEIAETIDKSSDAVKGMFDQIQEDEQAAEAEKLDEVALAEQARQENLKDYKAVKVLFQIFSLNTSKEHNTSQGRQGVVDFPNGSQLSTNITDQGVASISLVENGQISELGSYNAKTMEYSPGKDLKDAAASLQRLKEYVNSDFTIRPASKAKEVAPSIMPESVIKETPSKPLTEKPQLRTDKPLEERTLLNTEIEGQLIVKIVLEPDALNKAVEQGITAKSFDYLAYQEAFKAAQKLAADGKPTDLKSVVDELKNEQFTKTIINDVQAEQQLSTDYLTKAVSTKEFKQNTLHVANTMRRDAHGEAPVEQVTIKSIDLINLARDGKTVGEPAVAFSDPPKSLNNVASEQKVVAALITTPQLYQSAVEAGLTSESFTNSQNKKIFEAVADLNAQGEEVNSLSVKSRLETPEDKLLVSNLSANLPLLPTVVADIKTVIDLSTRRDLVKAADRLTEAVYNPKSSKQSLKSDLNEAKAKIDSSIARPPLQPPVARVKEKPVVPEKSQASTGLLAKMQKIAGKAPTDPDSATKKTSEAKAKKEKAPTEKKTTTSKKAPKATVVEEATAQKLPVATVQSEPSKDKGGR